MRDARLNVARADLPARAAAAVGARSLQGLHHVLSRIRPGAVALLACVLAAWIGYSAGANLHGMASGQAPLVWAAITVSAVALALYARQNRREAYPARLTVAFALLALLWMLQASRDPFAFSVGWLFAGLAVPLVCYVMLAQGTGRAYPRAERRLLIGGSVVVGMCWWAVALTSRQPTLIAPLIRCVPGCPRNVFFLGSFPGSVSGAIHSALRLACVALAFAVAALLALRWRTIGAAERRRSGPILLLSVLFALALALYLGLEAAGASANAPLGWVSLAAATMLPIAMLSGLVWERLFMGEALEGFVNGLGDTKPADVRGLMAEALHDPSVRIAYAEPTIGSYVDPSGAQVELPLAASHSAVTPVERDNRTAAFVIHDGALGDQERFIRAAGAAALISHENSQLDADLSATVVELAASRRRLVESGNAVRRRIERDLHDGIQQHIVGMRVKLEIARGAMDEAPERGQQMLAEIGREMDDALEDLRSVAQGVYPSLLGEYGLGEALKSAARRSPCPVSIHVGGIGRYALDVESAVYFCCLEALQNAAKHAGGDATVTMRLWEDAPLLRFETSDSGAGFTPTATKLGNGLINMRDRIAAVGGSLTMQSSVGRGTIVVGCVPIADTLRPPIGGPAATSSRGGSDDASPDTPEDS